MAYIKKDTAQVYRNEAEAGLAIRDSGLGRNDIFITTKYSGLDGLDIETSIQNSLKNVCHFSIFLSFSAKK
jgi:diketogulonate reductase-like aldo/keto reductase